MQHELANWLMQSSERLRHHGETLSTGAYAPEGWLPATVPGTVVAGLVAGGEYPDPFVGMNMKSMPGYKQGVTTHFSRHYMPDDSPFRNPWWYRTTFTVPETDAAAGQRVWLLFKGINYRANIWLNGRRIAGSDFVAGTFRGYDLDVTPWVSPTQPNVLALELFAPQPDDLALTFIDWNPVPPDDGMGIWQPVLWYTTGAVAMKHPFVSCDFDPAKPDQAALTLTVELVNTSDKAVACQLEGRIESLTVRRNVRLKPLEQRLLRLTPRDCPDLMLASPRLWWPYQLGTPELYRLDLQCRVNGSLSDAAEVTFGVRDIQSRINDHGARVYRINGREILIRGAAWVPDLMLRQSRERDCVDIAMLKTMNLNAIRLEGKLGSDHFWELCDREGIMVLAGWPCCNHWERWWEWKPGDAAVAGASLKWQLQRLRNHPALITWLYGSDFPPPAAVERMYLDILKHTHAKLPSLSSAAASPSALRGATGVRMSGPNQYVPPPYWYDTSKPGHAASFNLETCPDACIPVYESLKRFLPSDQCTPGSPAWNHHAGVASFADTEVVNRAVRQRYGEPEDVRDFAQTAQVLGYEAWRAMYEAYARNFPRATGVIGWMLNSAWPSVIWQLYDAYLQPTGAFYGTQKACERLHLQYAYDDESIWALNLGREARVGLSAQVTIRTLQNENLFERSVSLDLPADSRENLMTLPSLDALSPVYFLFLFLKHGDRVLARNVYWLSTARDCFARHTTKKFYWPVKKHADMRALRSLPPANITCHTRAVGEGDGTCRRFEVSLCNHSGVTAFFVGLKWVDSRTGELPAPVYWSENALTLLPGESWRVIARVPGSVDLTHAAVVVDTWNQKATKD